MSSILVIAISAPSINTIMGFSLRKKNYQGDMIPAAYGIWLVLFSLIGLSLLWKLGWIDTKHAAIYAGAVGIMGTLGLLDDIFGSRDVGGFKGHFKKLFTEGKLTTGAIKALGGGIAAIVIGTSISGADVLQLILAVGLVALSANTLNLLDLRPGRAAAAFFAGILFAGVAGRGFISQWAVLAVLIPAFIGYYWDRKGRAMMGDVGSNALGAVLGVTVVLNAPILAQALFLALLLALNIYSEKRSITEALESNPILRQIDRMTGVR